MGDLDPRSAEALLAEALLSEALLSEALLSEAATPATTEPISGAVIITGTDTGVGKTIVTAAIAAAATAAGRRVAVVKPAQTGTAEGDEPDAVTVARLAEPLMVRTLASFPDPLAPLAAARVAGDDPLTAVMAQLALRTIVEEHDITLIEGAGGLLVPMGEGGWTMLDLAAALGATAVVVSRAGLGTLNHTALTLHALAQREVPAAVVIGAWPAEPDLVHRTNLHDLAGDLVGAVPEARARSPRRCSAGRRRTGWRRCCTAGSTPSRSGPAAADPRGRSLERRERGRCSRCHPARAHDPRLRDGRPAAKVSAVRAGPSPPVLPVQRHLCQLHAAGPRDRQEFLVAWTTRFRRRSGGPGIWT